MSLKQRLAALEPKHDDDAELEKIINKNILAVNQIRKLLDPDGVCGNHDLPPVKITNWTQAHKNAAWRSIEMVSRQAKATFWEKYKEILLECDALHLT